MTPSHTSGPWSYRPLGPHEEQDRAVYCGARRIASVPHPDRIEPNAENDANARLIAAAPDLLAALTGLVAFVRQHINDADWNADEDVAEMKPALTAIDKAAPEK